jgi:flagellar biosynthetic protein FliR
MSAPVFSSRQIPIQVKIFLCIMLSAIIAMVTPVATAVNLNTSAYFLSALVCEFLIGYTLGFVIYALFVGVQLAGQLMDMQMGFGIVNVIDPQSGTQIPLIGNFQYILALLIFLGINGHHMILRALNESYTFIPVLGAHFDGKLVGYLMSMAAYFFVIGLKLAAPVVATIFVADVALGFIARTVPQMNVFIVGLPLKIGAGLLMILITMPLFIWVMQILMDRFFRYLDTVVVLLGK